MQRGTNVFKQKHKDITIEGWQLALEEVQPYMAEVSKDFSSSDLKNSLKESLASFNQTSFSGKNFEDLFNFDKPTDDWRIGEVFAQIYLENNCGYLFPWTNGMDSRTAKASLPGPELIGFKINKTKSFFAFGEVKTSSELSVPPGVMKGKSGLISQLKNILTDCNNRKGMVQYLAFRHKNTPWEKHFIAAFKEYLQDSKQFFIVGCLVRTTSPDEKDFTDKSKKIKTDNCNECFLIALYIPSESFDFVQKNDLKLEEQN